MKIKIIDREDKDEINRVIKEYWKKRKERKNEIDRVIKENWKRKEREK